MYNDDFNFICEAIQETFEKIERDAPQEKDAVKDLKDLHKRAVAIEKKYSKKPDPKKEEVKKKAATKKTAVAAPPPATGKKKVAKKKVVKRTFPKKK